MSDVLESSPALRTAVECRTLALAHLGLCRLVARRYRASGRARGLDVDDLIQEGFLGLWRAAELFDARRHVSFVPYARRGIHNAIRDALRNQSRRQRSLPLAAQARVAAVAARPERLTPDDLAALDLVRAARDWLTPRERCVLAGRFDQGLSLRAVGEQLGLKHERVREIQQDALRMLRAVLGTH